jgi:hypothetical protein
MPARVPFRIVELRWLSLTPTLHYPLTPAFALAGFREADGPGGTFSVYVKRPEAINEPGVPQPAKLFALADDMQSRLPEIGARFLLTAGTTVVGECIAVDRGEEEL